MIVTLHLTELACLNAYWLCLPQQQHKLHLCFFCCDKWQVQKNCSDRECWKVKEQVPVRDVHFPTDPGLSPGSVKRIPNSETGVSKSGPGGPLWHRPFSTGFWHHCYKVGSSGPRAATHIRGVNKMQISYIHYIHFFIHISLESDI